MMKQIATETMYHFITNHLVFELVYKKRELLNKYYVHQLILFYINNKSIFIIKKLSSIQ